MEAQFANATNNCLTFNGTNQYVSLPATLWNNNFSNGTAITVEYWYKKGDGSTTYTMNSVYRVQTGSYFVAGYYGSGGSHLTSTGLSVTAGNTTTINDGTWHHMAITWSMNGYFTSYFDGVQYAQIAGGSSYLPAMDAINYLASYNGSSEFLNGSLDEVRIWNTTRTAAQISANKDVELAGNESGLVAYYKMSNGSGTTLTDNASAGLYSGTLVNAPSWGTGAAVSAVTSSSFTYTGSSTTYTVPGGVNSITLEAYGAAGGYSDDGSAGNTRPGYGARMRGTFMVTPGQVLKVLVGGQGRPVADNPTGGNQAGGGGGGSFVTDINNNPFLVAGGGGGENWAQFNVNGADAATTNTGTSGGTTAGRGAGGGGFSTNGTSSGSNVGGYSFLNGGAGGTGTINAGGFGGGGGATYEGGGGGGYNGGNVITENAYDAALPTAAGSYNIGTSQSNSAAANSGNGSLTITTNAAVQGISYSGFIIPFISVSGTISTEQSFIVYGSSVSNNISITAPTGFEVSTTSGAGFANSLALTQNGGFVASTTIYVRLTNAASGTPSGNISLVSSGSTTVNIAAGGTVYTVPTTQSSSLLFSNVMSGQAVCSWTNGNGTNRVVFMKAASSGSASPVNSTTYTASTNFTSGTQIGSTGWYCVYNGSGNSVIVTGLSTTSYSVMVMEYNGLAGAQAYNTGSSSNNLKTFLPTVYTGSIQNYTVPAGITSITIEAFGAGGGYSDDGSAGNTRPGYGARMRGTFTVTPGQILKVLVGSQGRPVTDNPTGGNQAGGGGGGSFVTDNSNVPMIVAGGGGGENWTQFNVNGVDAVTTNTGTSGGTTAGRAGSGGGFSTNGSSSGSSIGGYSFLNGGAGGTGVINAGGFGGGGGATYEGGGGGGYNGGNVITENAYDAALPTSAGSYNNGTNQSNSAGANSGAGSVSITCNATQGISTSGTLAAFASLSGTASTPQSFTASGSVLTADIVVTAPTGFELCLTSGGTYTSTLTLTLSGTSVSSTTIYIRMTSAASGTPSGNVTLTSTGVTTVNVPASGTVTALPTTQATNITFNSTTDVSTTISWTNGNGSSRAVFMKATNTGTASPVNATTYTANTAFGSGTQIGNTGWYCVYNGTGTSVAVTNMVVATAYNVMVIEYNGAAGAQAYFTSTSTNNPITYSSSTSTFNYSGTIVNWTVPAGVTSIVIDTYGAQGGNDMCSSGYNYGGYGAKMKGTFTVVPGHILQILAGGVGGNSANTCNRGGGGGGGTFVYNSSTTALMVAAGGGGGAGQLNCGSASNANANAGTDGNAGFNTGYGAGGTGGAGGGAASMGAGGAGWNSNGASGSYGTGGTRFLEGGAGGVLYSDGGNGGFGGGGGCYAGAGGGGGYSGGGGGGWSYSGWGGGGGSYNNGTSTTNTGGARSGNGLATITFIGSSPIISKNGEITAFSTYLGSASVAQSTIISGINLTTNITVTAPTGYEVSVTAGSGYAGAITLTPTNGIVSSITVYVRLSSASTGTPSGNVALTSTGATTYNVAVSGTVYVTPTTQASAVILSSTSDVSSTISWTNGNGSRRAVFVKVASTGTAAPVNGTTYTANTAFDSGTQIGSTGWYCVYVGTGTSVAVTSLTTANPFTVMVVEFNGIDGAQAYFTSSAINNPRTNIANTNSFNYSGTIVNWTVPAGVTSITIDSYGAQGGSDLCSSGYNYGGYGAQIKGTFTVVPGHILQILAGGVGGNSALTCNRGGGGGGGTFVYNSSTSALMIAAGGGGGAGQLGCGSASNANANAGADGNAGFQSGYGAGGTGGAGGGAASMGAGGAGWNSNGASGSYGTGGTRFLEGGAGGVLYSDGGNGGFGGGGGCYAGAGGGGGYSGGGGGGWSYSGWGGGGGSYNNGTSAVNTAGARSGNGLVIITTYSTGPTISSTGTLTTFTIYAGTPSVPQSLVVSGARLTGDITVTAPTGFEVSLASGAGYAGNISVAQTSGTVASTTIYIRIKNTSLGSISGNIAFTSTDVVALNVAASGTVYSAPTTQATNLTFSTTADASTNIAWTNGNGSGRAVFIKETNTGSSLPVNGTAYTANTSFGSGTQIGSTGWYCVYNGTGSSVAVYNLAPSSLYMIMVVEYNGITGAQAYFTSTATHNPNSFSSVVNTINYSGAIVNWTVPAGVTSVTIDAYGAQGGNDMCSSGYNYGGYGAQKKGTFTVAPGNILQILAGGVGGNSALTCNRGGGGGGGTFVYNLSTTTLMVAAGGGGGAGQAGCGSASNANANAGADGNAGFNTGYGAGGTGGAGGGAASMGAGGAGWNSNGASGSYGTGGTRFLEGGAGGVLYSDGGNGGFGGGGGCYAGAGGGGGYSGGGGGGWSYSGWGGGGGSYNAGSSLVSVGGTRSGNGLVTITTYYTTLSPTIAKSGTLSAFSANAGSASTAQSFSASATGLTADITVTAPTGFEVCLTSGGTYTSTLSLTQTSGTVASTTVYVRIKSDATGTPSGNITLASTDATTVNVAVSGTVNAIPTIGSQPAIGGQTIALNGSATALTITAAAGSGSISTYQWYKNTTNANTGGTTVGTNAASYTPLTSATGTLYYYCVVTNSNTGAVSSNVSGAITVYALPSISSQPSTSVQNICQNGTATALTVTASAGSGTISGYQWYKNASNANTGGTTVGTSDASYTPVTTSAGALYYYCVVTNSNGGMLTSNVSGKVTIAALPTVASAVTASPTAVCSGASATLNAISTGNNINWYTAATGGTSIGTSASGANFVVNPTEATTYYAEAQTISSSSGTQTFNYTGSITNFTVPAGVTSLVIEAKGAQGGTSDGSSNVGGKGAYIKGTVTVTPGQILKVLVGGQGGTGTSGGGGGGSFVTTNANSGLVIAGGGGGAHYGGTYNISNANGTTSNNGQAGMNSGASVTGGAAGTGGAGGSCYAGYAGTSQGAGGGGLTGDGATCSAVGGGKSFTNGGAGGAKAGSGGAGGFGGGGGADWSYWTGGGGGGGYSGGGGGTYYGVGGGGGSYNAGTSQTQTAGYQTGNGQVVLSWTVVSSASCPASTRTAVAVGINTSASVASVTGSATICLGSTATYTANTVVLAGGTGAWSSSNTAVATVVASTGVATAVAAGNCNIVYTITNGCGGTVTSTKAITVSALPVLTAITGTTTFCKLATTTLANSSTGGTWASASTGVATVDASSGVVTGVTSGTALITYTYTNGGGCTNSISTTITVTDLPTVASSVTATPSTVLSGSATNLNATSTSNTINWFTAASGGTSIGSSASGANLSVTPSATTTYYAEAVSAAGTNGSQTFNYTGAQQTLTVPAGVTAVSIEAYGAQGGTARSGNGNLGGKGGYAKGNLAVTPGQTLYVYVGGQGGGAYNTILEGAGWNGGGHSNGSGDGGGGASDIRVSGIALSNRVIVAGGGGGNGWYSYAGGAGGGLTGAAGGNTTNSNAAYGGGGGTQSAGGVGSGTYPGLSGTLGNGGNGAKSTSSPYGYSGGGGGGYYGGAGGAGETGAGTGYAGAGGGGSSYTGGVTNATTTSGSRSGDGQILISWLANAVSCPSETRTAVTVTVNSKPTVTTDAISAIASTTATGGGNVTADGGSTVTSRGVCWSTTTGPTIESSKTTNSTGTGTFTSSMTSLTAGITYYVRAYATNAMGTSYGSEICFKPYTLGTFANINKTYGNAAFVLVNPTSTSTGTFSYESSNTNAATIVGNTVTIVGAGNSTITCTQNANSIYASANKTALLTVAKANQVLTLNPLPSSAPLSTLIGTPQLITASSSAGLTVTPSIASGPATVTFDSPNYYLTSTGSTGTAVVQINQAGNDNYNAAQITHSIDVTKGNQTITFATLSPVTYSNGLTVDLTTSSSSALSVGLAVVSGPATISGNTLTINGAGTVVVTASQAGNSSWNAATDVTRNLTVNKAAANITFAAINKTYGDVDFTVTASSASSGAFSYSSGNTNAAILSGTTATIVGAGNSTITVNQAASDDYTAGSTTALLTVDKADQTISIDAIADVLLNDFDGTPIQVTATSTSGLTVALTAAVGSKATINGSNQAVSTGVSGNVTINANQAGDDNYNAASQAVEVFVVNKDAQTITFAALAGKFSCDDTFELTATSTSALAPTFASSNEAVAIVSGTTVTIIGAGETTITASQAGNAYYGAASSVARVLTVTACVAPTIAATTAVTDKTSTTATSGGNVTADGGGAITERGICWSTSSNPTTADSKAWGGTGTGTFESSLSSLSPNTLYYVRAYATNSVNTVYGTQVSFTTLGAYTITASSSNQIIGSVTGGRDVDAGASISVVATPSTGFRFVNWTESDAEVSTSATYTFTANENRTLVANFSSLTVNVVEPKTATVITNCADCDVTVSNTGTLTVDASNKTVNSVTVEPGGKLVLTNPITVQDLTLKADNAGSFSTTVGSGMTVQGAFRYIKSMDDVQWYFISFPCNVSLTTDIKKADGTSLGEFMVDWEVYYYDGEARVSNLGLADNWKQIVTDHLVAYKGYIMGLRTGMGTVDVAFTLDKNIINKTEGQKSVPVTAWGKTASVASNHKGWNLVGQPYLSKFSGTKADVSYMLFPSNGGQTYDVIPKISGRDVDPFTAYFVQADAILEGTGIPFDVQGRQSAPASVASDITDRVDLNLNTVMGADKTGLVIDIDKNPAYIIGEDMEKWLGAGKPQVYTLLNNVKYAYNGLPMSSVVDLPVGVYTPNVGPAIISADAIMAPGLSQLLLTDKTTGKITDLLLEPYNYVATAGTTNTRFVLNAKKVATDSKIDTEVGGPQITIIDSKMVINNLSGRNVVRVFDAIGRMLMCDTAYDSSFEIPLAVEGVYTIQIQNGLNSWTKKVVLNR